MDNDRKQDNGNWLSAEQAVMPDGSQRDNLTLVRTRLPALAPDTTPPAAPSPSEPAPLS